MISTGDRLIVHARLEALDGLSGGGGNVRSLDHF